MGQALGICKPVLYLRVYYLLLKIGEEGEESEKEKLKK